VSLVGKLFRRDGRSDEESQQDGADTFELRRSPGPVGSGQGRRRKGGHDRHRSNAAPRNLDGRRDDCNPVVRHRRRKHERLVVDLKFGAVAL
jgi:hypothetical protein